MLGNHIVTSWQHAIGISIFEKQLSFSREIITSILTHIRISVSLAWVVREIRVPVVNESPAKVTTATNVYTFLVCIKKSIDCTIRCNIRHIVPTPIIQFTSDRHNKLSLLKVLKKFGGGIIDLYLLVCCGLLLRPLTLYTPASPLLITFSNNGLQFLLLKRKVNSSRYSIRYLAETFKCAYVLATRQNIMLGSLYDLAIIRTPTKKRGGACGIRTHETGGSTDYKSAVLPLDITLHSLERSYHSGNSSFLLPSYLSPHSTSIQRPFPFSPIILKRSSFSKLLYKEAKESLVAHLKPLLSKFKGGGMKSIKGYKAFNKDMTCRGFQFKEGETYEHKGELKICPTEEDAKKGIGGFHLCKNPIDVLNYYNLCDSVFAEAEALGKTDTHKEDSKVATTKIKIGVRLSLKAFVEASVNFLLKTCKSKKTTSSGDYSQLASSGHSSKLASSGDCSQLASSGDYSQLALSGHSSKLASSGDCSQLASSGHSSKLASSGDYSKLEMNGQDSVGAAIGIDNKAKGKKGNWITLAEWRYDDKKGRSVPVYVKSAKIDGKRLKEDTWYILKDKKFQEFLDN
jgi:ribosomal protein L21E